MSEQKKGPGLIGRLLGRQPRMQPPLSPDTASTLDAETAAETAKAPTNKAATEPALPPFPADPAGKAFTGDIPAPMIPAPVIPAPVIPAPMPRPVKTWWQRLRAGLGRTTSQIGVSITQIFTTRKLDASALEKLEDALIQADLGVAVATRIVGKIGQGRFDRAIAPREIQHALAAEVETVLAPVARAFAPDFSQKPFVVLMVGVNGAGKTTTIGKLAAKYTAEGRSVMLAAGDTFRAAAVEQLKIWAERTGALFMAREQGADAASLAYDAVLEARAAQVDMLFIDTAGRLQNKQGLMDELGKILRVLRKIDPQVPHACLLVLDATVGQNALSQVEIFQKVAGVNGLIMTKLDGTARGGILVALADKFGLPIHFIGVGESVEDLEPFTAQDFARAIAGLEEEA